MNSKVIGDRIIYVDPNECGNSQKGTLNKNIPSNDYEDYSMFINLSVIENSKDKLYINEENESITFKHNSFLKGDNLYSNKNINKNYLTDCFTHIEYDESTYGSLSELVGIERIDIDFNSWYAPTVSIKFIDIRGSGIFMKTEYQQMNNQSKTAKFFSAFFTMPYPIFRLTVKGYYGKSSTMDLTCTSVKCSLNNETGDYVLDTEFIGHTYAQLTDTIIDYCRVAPYINKYGKKYWDTTFGNENSKYKLYSDKGIGSPIPKITELFERVINNENKQQLNQDNEMTIEEYEKLKQESNNILQQINKFTDIEKLVNNIKLTGDGDSTEIKHDDLLKNIKGNSKDKTYISINNLYTKYSDELTNIGIKINGKNRNEIHEDNGKEIKTTYFDVISYTLIHDTLKAKYATKKLEELSNKIKEIILKTSNYKTQIIEEIFGFKPTLNNLLVIIFAHFQTLMYVLNENKKNVILSSRKIDEKSHDKELNEFISFPIVTENNTEIWIGERYRDNISEIEIVEGIMTAIKKQIKLDDILTDIKTTEETPVERNFFTLPYEYSEIKTYNFSSTKNDEIAVIEDLDKNATYFNNSVYEIITKYSFDDFIYNILRRLQLGGFIFQDKNFITNEANLILEYLKRVPKSKDNFMTLLKSIDITNWKYENNKDNNNIINEKGMLSPNTLPICKSNYNEIKDKYGYGDVLKERDDVLNVTNYSYYNSDNVIMNDRLNNPLISVEENVPLDIQSEYSKKIGMGKNLPITVNNDYDLTKELLVKPPSFSYNSPLKLYKSNERSDFYGKEIEVLKQWKLAYGQYYKIVNGKLVLTSYRADTLLSGSEETNKYKRAYYLLKTFNFFFNNLDIKKGYKETTKMAALYWGGCVYMFDEFINNETLSEKDKELYIHPDAFSYINYDDNESTKIEKYGFKVIPKHNSTHQGEFIRNTKPLKAYSGIGSTTADFNYTFNEFKPQIKEQIYMNEITRKYFKKIFKEWVEADENNKDSFANIYKQLTAENTNAYKNEEGKELELSEIGIKLFENLFQEKIIVYNTKNTSIIYDKEYEESHGEYVLQRRNENENLSIEDNFNKIVDLLLNAYKKDNASATAEDKKGEYVELEEDNKHKLLIYKYLQTLTNKWVGAKEYVEWIGVKETKDTKENYAYVKSFEILDQNNRNIGNKFMVDIYDDLLTFFTFDKTENARSLYTVITNILDKYKFLFIPLPYHSKIESLEDFKSVFKSIPLSQCSSLTNETPTSLFKCIYVNPSEVLDEVNNINSNDSYDYNIQNSIPNDLLSLTYEDDKEPPPKIQAFAVDYGSQNQSYWSNISLNMNNASATEPGLRAIYNIAANGNNNSLTSTQDLYNIYSQYVYEAEITMMGCMQVQPMMHFQLNNIMLWHGAYLVYRIRHSIYKNNMTTTFNGLRISKTKPPFFDAPISITDNSLILSNNKENNNPFQRKLNEEEKKIFIENTTIGYKENIFNSIDVNTSKNLKYITPIVIDSHINSYSELLDNGPFGFPIDTKLISNDIISSCYGWRTLKANTPTKHYGLDFATKLGTPVYASGNGIIKNSGIIDGFGECIIIEHELKTIHNRIVKYYSIYAHLSERNVYVSLDASKPTYIKKGHLIGKTGNTGSRTDKPYPYHLHYEIRKGSNARKTPTVNPLLYFANTLDNVQYEKIIKSASVKHNYFPSIPESHIIPL